MPIFKPLFIPFLANLSVSFFFLSVLSFKGSHNIAPFFLIFLGVGYCIYHLIKKYPFQLKKSDSWLIYSYLFYFSIFVLSLWLHGGKGRELDNPSRVILLIPAFLFLLQIPLKKKWLHWSIPIGSLIAGCVALYDKFILLSPMAYSPRTMHIQGGDIAMSLGIFSLAMGFYFWQKSLKKIAALCVIASLFGVVGSILSTARGGWPALFVALLSLLWIYRHTLSKSFFFSLIGIFILGGIGISQMPNNRINERLIAAQQDIQHYWDKQDASTSVGARFDMWKGALIMAQEKPLFGWGTEGAMEKRKQMAKEGMASRYTAQFHHAHNQYLDDLSKRGIIGLFALFGILLIPFYQFMRRLNHSSDEVKNIATLGLLHILSVMIYCLSQGFFTHNSGNIFYFFLTIVFYAMLNHAEKESVK